MSATWRAAADALVRDLQQVFATRLRAVVAYGPRIEGLDDEPLTCLALVDSLGPTDLEGCARVAAEWTRRSVAIPLILTADEFRQSLDAFPLEFDEIVRAHERVFGDDPFVGVAIAREDRRRACEHQIRSHLVHLREGFMEAGGRPDAVAQLVADSVAAFAALLRTVAGLAGTPRANRLDATLEGARVAGVAEGLVRDLLTLERRAGLPRADAARVFPEYLASVEQLARTVDLWRS